MTRVSPEDEIRELSMTLSEALSRPHRTIQYWLVSEWTIQCQLRPRCLLDRHDLDVPPSGECGELM